MVICFYVICARLNLNMLQMVSISQTTSNSKPFRISIPAIAFLTIRKRNVNCTRLCIKVCLNWRSVSTGWIVEGGWNAVSVPIDVEKRRLSRVQQKVFIFKIKIVVGPISQLRLIGHTTLFILSLILSIVLNVFFLLFEMFWVII